MLFQRIVALSVIVNTVVAGATGRRKRQHLLQQLVH